LDWARNVLRENDLQQVIDLLDLTYDDIKELFPKIGHRNKFLKVTSRAELPSHYAVLQALNVLRGENLVEPLSPQISNLVESARCTPRPTAFTDCVAALSIWTQAWRWYSARHTKRVVCSHLLPLPSGRKLTLSTRAVPPHIFLA
jgi:hypothetical protein